MHEGALETCRERGDSCSYKLLRNSEAGSSIHYLERKQKET